MFHKKDASKCEIIVFTLLSNCIFLASVTSYKKLEQQCMREQWNITNSECNSHLT
jgi:hypothetical protein